MTKPSSVRGQSDISGTVLTRLAMAACHIDSLNHALRRFGGLAVLFTLDYNEFRPLLLA